MNYSNNVVSSLALLATTVAILTISPSQQPRLFASATESRLRGASRRHPIANQNNGKRFLHHHHHHGATSKSSKGGASDTAGQQTQSEAASPTDVDAKSVTYSDSINIAVASSATTNCMDFDGLCDVYFDLFIAGTAGPTHGNNTANNETVGSNVTEFSLVYAEAAATLACGFARRASSAATANIHAHADFNITQHGDEIRHIHLDTSLDFALATITVGEVATASIADSESVAFAYAYQDIDDFCSTLHNSTNHTQEELDMFDATCNEQIQLAESYGMASAESYASSISRALQAVSHDSSIEVMGQDIEYFRASLVVGASSFGHSQSVSATETFTAAYASAVSASTSVAESCQEWYSAHCFEGQSNTNSTDANATDVEGLHIVCEVAVDEFCTNVYSMIAAESLALSNAFGASAATSVAAAELTFGLEVNFVKGDNETMKINLADDGMSPVNVIAGCL